LTLVNWFTEIKIDSKNTTPYTTPTIALAKIPTMAINYKFKLRDPHSNNPSPIKLIFYKNRKTFKYGIGYNIDPCLWDFDVQAPTQNDNLIRKYKGQYPQIRTDIKNIKRRTDKIIAKVNEWFSLRELAGEKLDLNHLREYLNNFFRVQKDISTKSPKMSKIYIGEFLTQYIKDISNGAIITEKRTRFKEATIKVFKSLQVNIGLFEDHTNKRLTIQDINSDLANEWMHFLYTVKKMSKSTVGKYNRTIKKVVRNKIREIEIKNYELSKQNEPLMLSDGEIKRIAIGLEAFKNISSQATNVYLTEDELNQLYELKNLSKKMEEMRDVFLCGCYTALRYSDYKRLSKEHIITENGKKRIKIKSIKTGNDVLVPIRHELQNILNKYNETLPKTYEQKLNKSIKEICKLAGIHEQIEVTSDIGGLSVTKIKSKYELISTHTARRTAATLMYLSGQYYKDIMAITEHKTLKSFETYLKISNEESIKRMEQSEFFKGNLLTLIK